MKRMLNFLSHVWTLYRLLSAVWGFMRDHCDAV
jgi:hypothetical protein